MGRDEKNFIDFIVDAQNDESLLENFINCQDEDALYNFFNKEHDYKVSKKDCEKLIKAKKEIGLTEGPIPPAY